ncbi:hypothetical protein AYM40_29185 [Paraburkholderia phytofirmans OLGA172]|uniref:Uncharacterized protein n=1 Tax=Paraburkholderia phytofirmans OLGA172 TaxID=1417228 RepID=A0A167WF69_9BURK|nr:hypothetical protein [Paraburkholderia phytofirmans]ANB76323.1 hypothetical protein AYM40_29185 [Paraburkholderia phytofirmans OLGA172]
MLQGGVVDFHALGFRSLSDFESVLSHMVSNGFKPSDFLDFFGKQYEDSPFIGAADRLYNHGTGAISFDPAPLVHASEFGAYVSAWVWVDKDPDLIDWSTEPESRPYQRQRDFSEQLREMQEDGLTAQMCIDYFGLRECNLHYVASARRQCPYARGMVCFDADPIVSESAYGAYVSAWLWVWNQEIGTDNLTRYRCLALPEVLP